MTKILITIGVISVVGISFLGLNRDKNEIEDRYDSDQETITEQIIEPELSLESYIIQEGDTFATIFESFGIGYSDMLAILDVSSSTYDFTSVRLGRELRYNISEGILNRLEYDIDTEEMAIVEYIGDEYQSYREDIEYKIEQVVAKNSIESSLFESAAGAGVDEATILDLAAILAWEIDFATEIQEGDSYIFVYDKRYRDGELGPSGFIHAIKFITSGREHYGFYFESDDGEVKGYFNEKGESLIKQFLKAPLRFSRITSGYSYARFHPSLGRTTPHRAIDYGAPLGTPIMTVGDGTVTFVGWNGGYGKMVTVHHNDVYTTRYAHMTSYAKGIKNGTRVEQGDIIGYVGSTGFSTGPHLHYEIKKHGTLVNPLKIELPSGDPIPEQYLGDFEAKKAKFMPFLAE